MLVDLFLHLLLVVVQSLQHFIRPGLGKTSGCLQPRRSPFSIVSFRYRFSIFSLRGCFFIVRLRMAGVHDK